MSADFIGWMRRVCGAVSAAVAGSVHAEVVTDGTVGPRVRLGGDFEIGAELGRRAGRNLFHSFERFSLATGERCERFGAPGVALPPEERGEEVSAEHSGERAVWPAVAGLAPCRGAL